MTFGLFLGTSVYCLMVLRTIGEDSLGLFVPHLSVTVGVLGGLVSLFALIYFLHDTASAIQARTVVRLVHADLEDAIDRLFPDPVGEGSDLESTPAESAEPPANATLVDDVGLGYLQAVDTESLMTAAVEHDFVVHLLVAPGTFVTPQTRVAAVVSGSDVDEVTLRLLGRCCLLGNRRTPRQDVVCAVDELVEVAVRALSPGINDPFTAITCVDYLGASLARLAERDIPSRLRRDGEGNVRVVSQRIAFPDVLAAAVEPLVRHALGTPSVLRRLAETLARVAETVVREEDAAAIAEKAEWLGTLAAHRLDDGLAVHQIETALQSINSRLDNPGEENKTE